MAGRLQSLICLLPCLLLLGAPYAWPVSAGAEDLDRLREAASGGDPTALFRLGERHERGEAVPRDIARAADYMRLAAERGHAEAQYRLGLYLTAGRGVDLDREAGYMWLARAAEQDAPIALVAAVLRDRVAEQLDDEALAAAQERAAAFEPVSRPASLPGAPDFDPIDGTAETLAARLPATGCGRPHLAEEAAALTVTAHLLAGMSPEAWRQEARAALADRTVTFELVELETPLCRVLELLDGASDRLEDGPRVALRDAEGTEKGVFDEGDALVIEVGPLSAPRHVFVDYFVGDGDVMHMAPEGEPAEPLAEGQRLTLGDAEQGGRRWEIGPPFGQDLLVVFATEKPLYGGDRSMVEPGRDYLAFLRNRLDSPLPGDAIGVSYRVVATVGGG